VEAAVAAADFGTWLWDIPTDTVRGDKNVQELFGLRDDSDGRPIADYMESIHPDDRPQVTAAINEALSRGGRYETDYRIVVDGVQRWVLARGVIKQDGNGNAVELSGVVLDISRQKSLESERNQLVEESDRQSRVFETTLSAITDFAYTFDLEGRFLYVNKPLLDLWGLKLVDAVGKNFFDLKYPDELATRLQQQIQTVIATRQRLTDETPYTSPTGADGHYEYIFTPVFALDGTVEAVAGSTRDVSTHVRAREALKLADRQKNEFLAMLAHELRNPLAPIRTAAELLTRTLPDADPSHRIAEVIKRQSAQMTRLIDDLLDISRISQGRIELKRQVIDVASIMTQALEAVGPLLREKNHDVQVTASYQSLQVNADPTRLMQCIGNVLTNAAKYTDAGGKIRVQMRADGADAVICVTDNGIGIPPELMPRLFDLFVQGDRTLDRSQGGLGIGLAVVKRLIEMHGGSVCASSRGIGAGTTFEIRIPRDETGLVAQPAAAKAAGAALRILVVDDNADAASSLCMLLSHEGHKTLEAHSGPEALDKIEDFRPDFVLLDIGLPGTDGLEVARRIRVLPLASAPRLVALTGYGQPEDRERTRTAGFDAHLVKPIDFEQLDEILSTNSGNAN
jgi:PAS domain S-box-containing protein